VAQAAAHVADTPALAGVLLDLGDNGLTVVATDRYQMACWAVPTAERHSLEVRGFVALTEVDSLVGWLVRRGTVTIEIDRAQLRLSGPDESQSVPCAQDRFPAYRLILDGQPDPVGRATLDRGKLRSAVAAGSGDHTHITVGVNRVTVVPEGASEGVHLEAMTSGQPITLLFASDLLAATLSTMVGEQVSMTYSAPDRAVQCTPVEQRRFTALVMPVRLER
jgi:DNA polymerase III sliding clamp (beta) subunit (PCNA family)